MTMDLLEGRRILVVEDESLLAMDIEATLDALGCVVVGPTGKLETAMELANAKTLDAAVLDVTIRGGKIYPVAERLLARGVPFVLASGYGDWALPEHLRGQPRLIKPFLAVELEAWMRTLCAALPDLRRAE